MADDSIIRTDTGLDAGLDTSTHSNTHAAPVAIGQAPLAQGREVLGIQGQLWSETVRSNQLVDYLTFPRLLMLAERAWHSPEWEVPYLPQGAIYSENSEYFTPLMQAQQLAQWQRLANTLGQKALVKLDKAKVEYRVPLAGAKIQDGLMHMNTSFPGLALEYREMNGQWQRWSHGVKVTLPVAVRARSADDKRAGRMLILRDSS